MDPHLHFSWATPEDLAEVVSFLEVTYGRDSIQAYPGRCRWLFFENPLGLHISLCRADGKLIAACGHLPQMIRLWNEMILAGFGIDFMVAKQWRRRGIGRKFLEMRLDRFPLSLSMGQSREMGALYRHLGAMDLGPLYVGIHRNRISFSRGLKALARNNLAWLKGFGAASPPPGLKGYECDIAQAANLTRQPDWFAWRYCSRPYEDYFCLQYDTGETTSLVVFRRNTDHDIIVDIHCGEKDRPSVLAAAANRDRVEETRIMVCGKRLKANCAQAGFWIRPQPTRVIAMTTDPGLRDRLEPEILDMTVGFADADLIRFPSES